MGCIFAIDLGGTQLRVAIYSNDTTSPISIQRTSTQGDGVSVFQRMTSLIDSMWPADTVIAICVACPGPLDPTEGVVFSTPNIPGWKKYPLVKLLQGKYHVPVFLDNDANLAAVGEWYYGAGQGHDNLVYITVSTGIGGGVICGGRLLTGHRGLAAEVGHMMVFPEGPVCSCGQRGHLEALSSGTAIARYVKEQLATGRRSILTGNLTISAREISAAATQGDQLCLEAFETAGKYLGKAVASLLHIFNPSILIFGGGVSKSGELLFKPMREVLYDSVMDPAYLENLQVKSSLLGDDVGLLGALAQAKLKLPNFP